MPGAERSSARPTIRATAGHPGPLPPGAVGPLSTGTVYLTTPERYAIDPISWRMGQSTGRRPTTQARIFEPEREPETGPGIVSFHSDWLYTLPGRMCSHGI